MLRQRGLTKADRLRFSLLLLICVSLVQVARGDWPRPQGPKPTVLMDVQAFFVSDDDGRRRTPISPLDVAIWVDKANEIFASANIHLGFDPAEDSSDWQELSSTLVNSMSGVNHPDWQSQKAAANFAAAFTPEKMATFFRWGPNPVSPTGAGFSWTDYNFIAMPGFTVTQVCGEQNIGIFAHEVGHYLGLPHTFAQTFSTVSEAESYFISNGRNPAIFEGDGRDDTPPDPFTRDVQCDPNITSVDLDGTKLPLPRRNIMSYYYPRDEISESQAWTLRSTLLLRTGQSLTQLVAGNARDPLEAEDSNLEITAGFSASQTMGSFLGKWSQDKQLFWIDGSPGDTLTFDFELPSEGRYQVYAAFTAAPDYGILEHRINGQNASSLDLYSKIVLPTGPIDMGRFDLAAGENRWQVTIAGSNPSAVARHGYGLDYVMLVPIPEPTAIGLVVVAVTLLCLWRSDLPNHRPRRNPETVIYYSPLSSGGVHTRW